MITKKILKIGIIMFMAIMLLPTISKAGVESKAGGTVWTSITPSYAYDVCYNMRNETSTLGKNSLDPHLALSKDWGAVAYLAMSPYGGVSAKTASSTTGNASGVYNFGANFTYLSAIIENGLTGNGKTYGAKLIENKDSNYVELLPASPNVDNTRGMAIKETQGWYSADYEYCSSSAPFIVRYGICGIKHSYKNYYDYTIYGDADSRVTFRPAIWNK